MSRFPAVTRRDALRLVAIGLIGVAAIGYAMRARADDRSIQRGPAIAGTPACQLLTTDLARTVLPKAKYESDTFDDPNYCFYAENGPERRRSVQLSVYSVERARVGRTTEPPPIDEMYATLIREDTETGSTASIAQELGDYGQLLTDAKAADLVGIWKRGNAIYRLNYSGWGSSPRHAQTKLIKLAKALELPS